MWHEGWSGTQLTGFVSDKDLPDKEQASRAALGERFLQVLKPTSSHVGKQAANLCSRQQLCRTLGLAGLLLLQLQLVGPIAGPSWDSLDAKKHPRTE